MRLIKYCFTIVSIALLLGSCGSLNSNLMFKEFKGEEITDTIPLEPSEQYRLSVDDKITFRLAPKMGEKLMAQETGLGEGQGVNSVSQSEYRIRKNGTARLPIVGEVSLIGLTLDECEDSIASMYSEVNDIYEDPLVSVQITNQRVIVFPGNGSDAQVVKLENANTTLMEVIATAGGITERGKADRIKIIRRENGERKMYVVDLSTVEGLKYVDMIVQANDYVYVEPTADLPREVSERVAPVVSLISSAIFIVSAVLLLK